MGAAVGALLAGVILPELIGVVKEACPGTGPVAGPLVATSVGRVGHEEVVEAPEDLVDRIRVERAHASVAKDTFKAQQISPYEERLEHINEQFMDETKAARAENVLLAERKNILDEYREMLEEFKISLFAPEMKTAFPVSPKRLDKKWKEIEKLF